MTPKPTEHLHGTTSFFDSYFDDLRRHLTDADAKALDRVSQTFAAVRDRGRKVLVAGNGGSAAIASHVAVDLTKAVSIRSVNFNEAGLITCFANDYGYEQWLAKAIEAYGDAGDVAVLISSSGRSPNMLNAARRAAELGLTVVTLSGFDHDNPLRWLGEQNLWVNSRSYNIVETVHQTWLLAAMDRLLVVGDLA
ncbi:MAG: phosphoheptose isomerase [Gemmatimonadetes bacterium]|nr:phosphoheptose isomerase [Gemmatimonadota bacterium]